MDLEAVSDSGISSTDNLTNASVPIFDVAAGPYWRVYENGDRVGGISYASGSTWTDRYFAEGTYALTVAAVDAAGNESAPSDPLGITMDRTAPTAIASTTNITSPLSSPHSFSVTYSDPSGLILASLAGAATTNDGVVSYSDTSNGSPRSVIYKGGPPNGIAWGAGNDGLYLITSTGAASDLAGNVIPYGVQFGSFVVAIAPPAPILAA